MQSYYLLSLLCLWLCAVAKCEITTGLDCRTETKTKILTAEKTASDYYCQDGALANYDKQSARHHCCSVPLRQGKCPGECRNLRSKISMRKLSTLHGNYMESFPFYKSPQQKQSPQNQGQPNQDTPNQGLPNQDPPTPSP